MASSPTLLWLHTAAGVSVDTAAQFVCLAGVYIAFYAALGFGGGLAFAALWLLQVSLVAVGQGFLSW
jgi:hypothetical protein